MSNLGRHFFVDATLGNDANGGLFDGQAKQTLAGVGAMILLPKDVTDLKRGETLRETLTMPSSGVAGKSIQLGAYGAGAAPIISGADVIAGWAVYNHWFTAFSQALGENADGAANRQRRQALSAADISGIGTQIRVTLKAASGGNAVIDGTSFGQRSGTSDDMAAAPTRITWDTGNNGVTILAGTEDVSDAIVFTLDDTVDHLVHVLQNSGTYSYAYQSADGGGSYNDAAIAGDETMDQNVDYAGPTANFSFWITKVEAFGAAGAWQSALTTEPNQVFMDDTRLTEGADQDSLNDHEWYWTANVLYVRDDSGDPDGTGVVIEASARTYCIDWNAKDYIAINNIDTTKSNTANVRINGDNFVIQDMLSTYAYSTCISVNAAGAAVTAGLIRSCETSYSNTANGIYVGWTGDPGPSGVIVEYCNSHDNGAGSGDHGIYFNYAHECVARYNLLHDNPGNGAILQNGSDDNQIYYNLIYDNAVEGVWIGTGNAGEDNLVYNNVVINHGTAGIRLGTNAAGNLVKNNIVFQDSAVVGDWAACLKVADDATRQANTFDNNDCYYEGQGARAWQVAANYYNLAGWQGLTGSPGADSISADPLFVTEFSDLHLQAGSPCRDAGTDVNLVLDYVGVDVPQEDNPAIGAYEYVA